MERGRLGDKVGQGFYQKTGKSILTLDLDSGEYRERREPDIPSIAEGMKIKSLPQRLKFVLAQEDKAGTLARHVVYNTLGYAARRMIDDSVEELERGAWVGMVIGNDGADFCVCANLSALSNGVERAVREMQDALMAVRFCAKPIVAAPFGRTLAGGAEVAMAAARIVAAAETYMGQVEVGVGLVPAAGGCKELIRRVVSPVVKQ